MKVWAWILVLLTIGILPAHGTTLAWDYDAIAPVDSFVLQRKLGAAGIYADLIAGIPAVARTVLDATGHNGKVYCYRLLAVLSGIKSRPSNEVCLKQTTTK